MLDSESQLKLLEAFEIPESWTYKADHMTVCLGFDSGQQIVQELGGPHALYELEAIAFGELEGKVKAVKVVSVTHPCQVLTCNSVAHITLAVAPNANAKDSNLITEWRPISAIGPLRGIVSFVEQFTVRSIKPLTPVLSLGKLVQSFFPEITSQDLPHACKVVKEHMIQQGILNDGFSEEPIRALLKSLKLTDLLK